MGVVSYWLRWTSGDPTLAATKWTAHKDAIVKDFYRLSSTQAKALKDGEMYTFELTAVGDEFFYETKQDHERSGVRHGADWHGPDTDTPGDGGVAPRVAPHG